MGHDHAIEGHDDAIEGNDNAIEAQMMQQRDMLRHSCDLEGDELSCMYLRTYIHKYVYYSNYVFSQRIEWLGM